MFCDKVGYDRKKIAKRSARHLTLARFGNHGSKYSVYHCKECGSWHLYTENRAKLISNTQHARGGRRRRRR